MYQLNLPSPVQLMHALRFQHLLDIEKQTKKDLYFHIFNANSLRNKFSELHSMLVGGYIDIFGITETKLNESFPHSQFTVDGFSMYSHRLDRDENGGDIACYVNSDIPHRMRKDCSYNENIQTAKCTPSRFKYCY